MITVGELGDSLAQYADDNVIRFDVDYDRAVKMEVYPPEAAAYLRAGLYGVRDFPAILGVLYDEQSD